MSYLFAILILAAMFGFLSFAFYAANRMRLGLLLAIMAFLTAAGALAAYPVLDAYGQELAAKARAEKIKIISEAFGNKETYYDFIKKTGCDE